MPKQKTVLQIFLASPSDVSEERAVVETVVAELNRTWASELNVVYEVCRWEKNVRPGFGDEPQDVVNEQIPGDYDVFVGIFWGRIGTETKRHRSGTLEEFRIALDRFRRDGSPEIMIYFKHAPISPSRIDPDQFKQLTDFRNSISSLGGLYFAFEDQSGFESSLRSHLAASAKRIISADPSRRATVEIRTSGEASAVVAVDQDDDLGYLDYIDLYIGKTKTMTDCLNGISFLIQGVGAQMSERSQQMEEARSLPDKARYFMRRSAEDMDTFARSLDVQIDVYRASRIEAFDALSRGVALHGEIIGKDGSLVSLQETLRGTLTAIEASHASVQGFREAVADLPRMIKEVNSAKRHVARSLDAFLIEMESTQVTAAGIIDAIDKLAP